MLERGFSKYQLQLSLRLGWLECKQQTRSSETKRGGWSSEQIVIAGTIELLMLGSMLSTPAIGWQNSCSVKGKAVELNVLRGNF